MGPRKSSSQSSHLVLETEKRIAIPITVRQLEAVIRISESLAKMELLPFVIDRHVEESLRIFQVIYICSNVTVALLIFPITIEFSYVQY